MEPICVGQSRITGSSQPLVIYLPQMAVPFIAHPAGEIAFVAQRDVQISHCGVLRRRVRLQYVIPYLSEAASTSIFHVPAFLAAWMLLSLQLRLSHILVIGCVHGFCGTAHAVDHLAIEAAVVCIIVAADPAAPLIVNAEALPWQHTEAVMLHVMPSWVCRCLCHNGSDACCM